jgi:PAS domain S-box-containing protein
MNKMPHPNADFYRVAVESAPSGMVMIDASGSIMLVNRETERLFGYTRDELLGHSIEMLVPERFRAKHPQYREEFFAHPGARLMGGGRDLYGLRKDGTEIPVEIGLNPIQTDEGLVVLSAVVDISERKRAEKALRQTSEELKRSNQQLEQFAYVASHDLQEPLRAVIGFLQLLDERYKPLLDGKAEMYIDYAVEGAKRMSQLINDLLDYSRVERRGQKTRAVDLNGSFRIAMANLQASIDEAMASITCEELPTVDGNEGQLVRLFQNLLGNAIKFRRKEMALQIHVSCNRQSDNWLISVRDNGIGIAPEFREKVFLIFQRLHGQKEYPGTGIGLAVCRKIVEQHGGRIWIESELDPGATFYFTLPIKREIAADS